MFTCHDEKQILGWRSFALACFHGTSENSLKFFDRNNTSHRNTLRCDEYPHHANALQPLRSFVPTRVRGDRWVRILSGGKGGHSNWDARVVENSSKLSTRHSLPLWFLFHFLAIYRDCEVRLAKNSLFSTVFRFPSTVFRRGKCTPCSPHMNVSA